MSSGVRRDDRASWLHSNIVRVCLNKYAPYFVDSFREDVHDDTVVLNPRPPLSKSLLGAHDGHDVVGHSEQVLPAVPKLNNSDLIRCVNQKSERRKMLLGRIGECDNSGTDGIPFYPSTSERFRKGFGISSDTGSIIDPYRGGPWTPACVIELNLLHRTSVPFDGSWRSGTRADYTNGSLRSVGINPLLEGLTVHGTCRSPTSNQGRADGGPSSRMPSVLRRVACVSTYMAVALSMIGDSDRMK